MGPSCGISRNRSMILIWSIWWMLGDNPPWTQKIASSITTESVKKSNMSVKYCQTAGLPYFRVHSR